MFTLTPTCRHYICFCVSIISFVVCFLPPSKNHDNIVYAFRYFPSRSYYYAKIYTFTYIRSFVSIVYDL